MLDLPRAVVHQCAAEECARIDVTPWQDPHNADPSYSRVRVREALPLLAETLGEGVIGGLSRSAQLLRDDADALDAWAMVEVASHVLDAQPGCSIDVMALESMPQPLADEDLAPKPEPVATAATAVVEAGAGDGLPH
jgi:tRNA(Ile)-lysidine synthase